MPVEATWTRGMEFQVRVPAGETYTLTSIPKAHRPGPGPSPMESVQGALAACTGMDVVSILEKMRKTLRGLRIEVETVRQDEHPRIYTDLTLVYYVDGPDLDDTSVARAVELSQDKYCSVAAMLRPTVHIGRRIVLNGKLLPTP
jgi:putative redox protein